MTSTLTTTFTVNLDHDPADRVPDVDDLTARQWYAIHTAIHTARVTGSTVALTEQGGATFRARRVTDTVWDVELVDIQPRQTATPVPVSINVTAACAHCGEGLRQTAPDLAWWHRATGSETCAPKGAR